MKKSIAVLIVVLGLYVRGTAQTQDYGFEDGATDTCVASFYHNWFQGKRTASGIMFNNGRMYAAHKEMPFGTILRITNTENGKSVIVKVVDRGPYIDGRELDLSSAAADSLGYSKRGLAKVVYEIMPKNSKAAYKWRKEEKLRTTRAMAEEAREEAEALARAEAEADEANGNPQLLHKLIGRFTTPALVEKFAWAGKKVYHFFTKALQSDETETTVSQELAQAN